MVNFNIAPGGQLLIDANPVDASGNPGGVNEMSFAWKPEDPSFPGTISLGLDSESATVALPSNAILGTNWLIRVHWAPASGIGIKSTVFSVTTSTAAPNDAVTLSFAQDPNQ